MKNHVFVVYFSPYSPYFLWTCLLWALAVYSVYEAFCCRVCASPVGMPQDSRGQLGLSERRRAAPRPRDPQRGRARHDDRAPGAGERFPGTVIGRPQQGSLRPGAGIGSVFPTEIPGPRKTLAERERIHRHWLEFEEEEGGGGGASGG